MKLSTHVSQRTSDQGMSIISIDNQAASLELSLFGAHVLSYMPKKDSRQRLYMSPCALMDGSKAIRGGIPICWPWFGQHEASSLPAHGYLRTRVWRITRIDDDLRETRLQLQPGRTRGEGFDGCADVTLTLLVGDSLSLSLDTQNIGQQPFSYNAALHSYFRVSDIHKVRLAGLDGDYLDKVRDGQRAPTPDPYTFEGETDRIHLCQTSDTLLTDPDYEMSIGHRGHDSIVVWNPWQQKSEAMADMPDGDYRQMLCIETAITQGKRLAPDEQHQLVQIID
ncbi:D-hexose-6-phosphate mutarotase [Bowmanella dokdonensis]